MVFGVPTTSRGTLVCCARNRKSFRHMGAGIKDSDPNVYYLGCSYAVPQSQRVRVNNSFSSWQEVTSSIPQGSVIGPLLLVIIIYDLPEVINSSELFLFADADCTSLQQDLILHPNNGQTHHS